MQRCTGRTLSPRGVNRAGPEARPGGPARRPGPARDLTGPARPVERPALADSVPSGPLFAQPEPVASTDSLSPAERILQALRRTGGNKAKAARLLGIDRTTLYRKIKELRLDLSRVDF